MELTKKNDFVEIKFTGYANGQVFDSNIEEDLKKINPGAKQEKTILVIGQGMVVSALDKALEDKEIGKEYHIEIPCKEAFGQRDRKLIKTIPLASFTEQEIDPKPGMVLALDNSLVKIIAVSGARVTADFNNPLAGKDIKYKFTISRFVDDIKEKTETLLQLYFKFIPEFEIKENEVIIKGEKLLERVVEHYKDKLNELTGKELKFEEKKEENKVEKKIPDKTEQEKREKTAIQ